MLNSGRISPMLLNVVRELSTDNSILMDLLLGFFRTHDDLKRVTISIRDCYDSLKLARDPKVMLKLAQERRDLELVNEHLNREITRIELEVDNMIDTYYTKSFRKTYEKLVDSYKHNLL